MGEMTEKEFLELLQEFSEKTLNPKFTKIDSRFEKIDSQFVGFKEEIVHQFHVISEDLIGKIQLVAEGVANLNEKFDHRLDELEKKNDSQHKDILAAIKFSYAELDRRITNLESEMETLKRRMDILERRSVS